MPYASAAQSSSSSSDVSHFEPFTFAFISDCHLTSGVGDNFMLLQESQLFLQEAIKQINALKPDFVIFGGDQVQGIGEEETHWQLFLDIAQNLDCSWYFVLGETDVSGNVQENKMRTFGRDWKGRGLNNNVPYWSCDPLSGLHLIGLDTSQANTNRGYIDDVQLDWLRQDMMQNAGAINVIVSHHPILPPVAFESDNSQMFPQAGSVREILEKSSGYIISLNGHTHLSKIQCQNNIWYISSPSLDIYPCAFRFFRVTAKEVQVDTHQVNFPALVKLARANMVNSNVANSLGITKGKSLANLALGSHTDQSAILFLKESGRIEKGDMITKIR